jgi:hypothetical protein
MRSPANLPRRAVLAALAAAAATGPAHAAPDRVAGSGPVLAQTRRLDPFTGVALALPAQVELRIGSADSITIETNENLLPFIEAVVENGTLRIRPVRRGMSLTGDELKMVVTARRIERLSLAGSGAISGADLHAPRLNLDVAGGGSIALARVACEALAASIAGAGLVTIDGTAPDVSASIAGAGKLRAERLKSRAVNVNIVGSGEATVWAAGTLNASVAGSGTVRYYGSPKVRAATVGSGSAERIGPSPS